MSGYTDFIKRFSAANVGPAPTVPNNPDTFYRIAAARQNQTGQSNPDPVEQDLMNLSTSDIIRKYGPAGVQMVQQRALGDARFTRDRYDPTGNTPFDVGTGAIKGFLTSVGGLAVLGGGLVNDDLGAWGSEKLSEFDNWVKSNQSSGLNAHRRANQVSNAIEYDDNKAIFEQERKDSGDFVAGLRRIGRDAISAVGNAVDDPTVLGDGLADAAGSLLAGGVISKGAKFLGSKAIRGLLSRGVLSEGAALKAMEFGSKVSMPTTIGGMEAGGAYQQTVQSIMEMSHDDLVLGSPEYSKLISEGWTAEDAKVELATSAGLTAAALQFPVAAAAGTLVSKFEANPFRGAMSGLGVVKNGATQAIEEAVQSGFGQFAGNVGTQAFANQNQDLTQGVGEQAGLGGLYGMGSAVGVQVPGLAVNATVAGVKAAASGAAKIGSQVVNAVDSRVSAIKDGIASASPVSADNINSAVETKLAEAPAILEQIRADVAEEKLAPDQGKIIEDRLNQLTNTISFDRAELDQTSLSPEIKEVIGAATNKFDALRRASILAGSTEVPPQARIEAAIYINDTLNTIGGQMVNDLNQAVEPLPDDHSSLPKLREFEDVLINLQNNPEIQNARKAAISHVEKLKADSLSEAAVATPKGEQAVRAVASVAESNPEAISEDMANPVLEHARLGRVKLTPRQLRAVQSSATLSRVGNTYKIESKKAGITERDIVNKQILTDEVQGSDLPSMAGHVKGVNEAYSAGNVPLAAERLQRFAAFAQHFQNKLAAINEAYATGADSDKRAVKYQALMPSGKWDRSIKGVYVKPTTEGSLKHAQSINLEARALADVANEMALRMPELGVNPVEVKELNPDLIGNVKQLVQKFRNPAPKAPTKLIELVEEPAKVEPAQAQPSTVQTESVSPTAATETVDPSDIAANRLLDQIASRDPAKFREPDLKQLIRKLESFDVKNDTTKIRILGTLNDLREKLDSLNPSPKVRGLERFNRTDDMAYVIGARNLVPLSEMNPKVENQIWGIIKSANSSLVAMLKGLKIFIDPSVDGAPYKFNAQVSITKDGSIFLSVAESTMRSIEDGTMSENQFKHIILHEITHVIDELAGDPLLYSKKMDQNTADYLFDTLDWAAKKLREVETSEELLPLLRYLKSHRNSPLFVSEVTAEIGALVLTHPELISDPAMSRMMQYFDELFSTAAKNTGVEYAGFAPTEGDRSNTNVSSEAGKPTTKSKEEVIEAEPVEGPESSSSTNETTKPETKAEPEPTPEPAPVEGPEENLPASSTTQPETVEVQTVGELYPDLYEGGKVQNWLKRAFKLPKTDRTRTIGTGNPAAVISEAMSSQTAYEELLGKKAKKTLSTDLVKDYQTFLGLGQKISQTMAENLSKFLEVKTSKEGPTFREALLNGLASETQVNEFIRGKVLAIVQQVGENDFGYNSELAEAAVLAGLQYVLVAGAKTSNFDAESLAKMLNIEEIEAAPHVAWFNQGVWTKSAKRELADMVTKYWGLSADSSMPEGIVRGIPESVASEVIRGLLDAKLLLLNETEINGKPYEQYVLNPENEALLASLKRFPTAIEEAVLVEPENINHIGTPPSSAAKSQLHGSPVKLKAKQVEFIETAQKVAHRVNTQMLDFTRMLGAAGIEGLFGRGKRTLEKTNVNTAKSIEGYNRTVMSAYSALTDLVSEMENYAKTNDMALEDVDVFYEYGISSVGRAQMQGRANPQSSKIVREVMLPTWSTLDLTDKKSDHYQAFMLAVGQHIGVKVHKLIGVKVHKLKAEKAIEETETKLGEVGFAGLINDIESWMDQWDGNDPLPLRADDFAPFKKVLGDKTAPGAVHALMEYSRYLNATPEERAVFKTGLYLEADGVTDGPINALVNLVGGIFKPEWVNLVNRGGLFLGSREMSLADYIAQREVPYGNSTVKTDEDLYQLNTNFLVDAVKRMTDKVKSKKPAKDLNDALQRVMADVLPDMQLKIVDGKPVLKFERGITKNPLTVTVYGSGVRGIGSKITAAILENLYEIYPTYADLPDAMRNDLRYLSTFSAYNKFGEIKLKKRKDVNLQVSPDENFTLTPSMVKSITDNVTTLFAQPLTEAISETMGDAMASATVMRRATQAQSIFFKYAYRQGIADALALKGTKAGQFLSRDELDGIFRKLLKRFPLIETDAQMIWVGGSAQSDIETSEFGKALDESQGSPGYVYGPENAGVSGIPFIVIATGDGEMILNALTGEDAPQNTLPVFDGINLKLDTIKEDSRKINKAVYDGWLRNPLRSVEQSFTKFLEDGGITDARGELSDEMMLELEKTFKDGPDFTFISPEFHLKDIHVQLQDLADELDARKAVLAKVNMSVDHMASAAAPYVKTDGIELPADPVAASQILNRMLADEMKKLPKRKPLKIYEAPSEDVSKFIELVSDEHVTGARILDLQAMRLGIDELNIPLDQKSLVRASINSLATEGWSIVHGNVDQLATHASYYDITLPNNWSEQYGLALPDSKTIFLMSSSSEALTHELIHAATVQQVFAYYSGGKVQKDVPATIQRIEALMSDFLKIDPKSIKNDEALKDFLHVRDMLNEMSNRTDGSRAINKTQALNEFMAWTLANQGLSDIARRNDAGPLARMVKAVMDAMRKLFWRAGLAPSAGTDIYSNLRFNTLLLMQPKAYNVIAPQRLVGMAQFQSPRYGSSDRLSELEVTFARKMLDALPADTEQRFRMSEKYKAMNRMAAQVRKTFQTAKFDMSPKEASFFETLVMALAVDKSLNSNAQSRLEEMFRHVLDNIVVEDFMEDRDRDDPNDRRAAQRKYNTLVGRNFVGKDLNSRSMMMPAFLALAMVNEGFRSVLAKMPMPQSEKRSEGTLDSVLSTYGVEFMDRLSRSLSGEGNPSDVLEAVEALTAKMVEVQSDREVIIESGIDTVGNGIDTAQDWVVSQMNRLTQQGADKLAEINENTDNKYVKLAARAGEAMLGVFNEDISAGLVEGYTSQLNKAEVWKPVRELFAEVVGRTEANAPIYDMIKAVRSHIQQLRQIYREKLPAVIAEKFSRKLTKDEWSSLYHTMAKTDLAALRPLGSTRVLDMLRDAGKLKTETARLEATVRKLDGTNGTKLLQKSQELAEYMTSGKVSGNLLQNADAIANLFDEIPARVRIARGKPTKNLVSAIDQLTSLYALAMTSTKDRTLVAELAANEGAGVDFAFNYLVGQKQNENEKLATDRGRINRIKGYVPTENRSGSSLVVADDRNYQDLITRGYTRLGDYKGSLSESGLASQGYYFAPLSGKSAFNQGIAQNVRDTFHGVDPVSGFRIDSYGAGRITDQIEVRRIYARRGLNQNQKEALIPIRDSDGDVVAYERSLDPDQLAKVEKEEDLSKVLGIWRGRQVEEKSADQFNRMLVERVQKIWEDRAVGRDDEFINLMDEKSH